MKAQNIAKKLKGNSHPEKRLSEHLFNCLRLAEQIKQHHQIQIDVNDEILTHDSAKEHPLFQKHLKNKSVLFPHSEPSSYLTFFLTQNILSAEVVRHHHSNLESFENVKSYWLSQSSEQMYEKIREFAPFVCFDEETLNKTEKTIDTLLSQDKTTIEEWYTLRLKASILSTVDRMEAIGVEQIPYSCPQIIQETETFIQQLQKNKLSEWRNMLRQKILQKTTFLKTPGIYSLTLPTGSGKTLIGLEIANHLNAKTLIYALPYISIIDQNAKIAQFIYKEVQQDHHLASAIIAETPLDHFVQAFRYWLSPVIVTTFVSLWDTLYSPHYNATMNFHRLQNSVIILDEVQILPPQYWSGFLKTMNYLTQKMNITLIMMTATQPSSGQTQELSDRCFFPEKRHRYHFTQETNLNGIFSQVDPAKNTMIILNTRKSALNAYRLAKEKLQNTYFLSKWIIPKERIKRIEEIRLQEKAGKKRHLITTQLVEAGVDLDFDHVIRDMAPLDCLVQSGGRCNRNLRIKEGTITICELVDDLNRPYASYVYDKILLNVTKSLLEKHLYQAIDEQIMEKLLKDYYDQIHSAIMQEGPWEAIIAGKWGEWYPLILKRIPEASVIIDTDGKMKILLDELEELPKKVELLNTKRKIWKEIGQNTITVPKNEIELWDKKNLIIDDTQSEIVQINEWLYYIAPSGIGKIYTEETGFIPFDMSQSFDDSQ